ncbi:ABC-three component system protein [Acanthopleuribacter pedis]|uniref:ABC-three component systems C-terminal domain-containing protein n=1 Tax=Acanthopleuribacter pedis TaxID=442870 RepID=A0A8J7U3M3_9BACT|nr:ABC-three component system protein [Acanthopleuribacter pedis]MBO1318493.1 hypothetical protein [Acanthopleuribacter pedis]
MKYAFHELSYDQFENLVVCICMTLFGNEVQGFAKGPDGGKDAQFRGTAEAFPSTTAPWSGTTIIQAKHTIGQDRTFSDSDFFSESSQSATIQKELPRIKRLRAEGELDHYLLIANRRLSGTAESRIRRFISSECNIPEPSISLCGTERLELWLKKYPNIALMADIDPIDSPLIVSPDDLAEVVEALAENNDILKNHTDSVPTPRVPYDQKHRINNMTPSYAKAQQDRYLKDTKQIQTFLAAPENAHLLQKYEDTVESFQFRILSKRKDYQTFDEIFEYLIKLLQERDPVLRKHQRLMRRVLFYMYWHCDIGETEDA